MKKDENHEGRERKDRKVLGRRKAIEKETDDGGNE